VVCEQAEGTVRCVVCSKAKQACLYHMSDAGGKGKAVAPLRDAAEESSEEEEEEEEEVVEKEKEKKGSSPLVNALKKITSPLKAIGKRKTTELSPGSVKDREAESSERARARKPSPSSSFDIPEPSHGSSSFYSVTMPPPPSIISTGLGNSPDPFYVRRLENSLRESQEDLTTMRQGVTKLEQRYASRESLLLEEIALLKANIAERDAASQSGKRGAAGSSSGRRGGTGSSSGKY